MKKAVVTGGAGFIGSHLVDALVERDWQVVILDDLSTGSKENIGRPLRKGKTELVTGSVTALSLLRRLFRGAEYVFHLAAVPGVPASIARPRRSHEVNATGTLNVLLAARDNGVKKVVYASSSAVYGDNPRLPHKEDLLPEPRSPYAVAKLAGEHYCRVFQQVYGLPTVCLRYFNVYGPRQDPASDYAAAIPHFLSSLNRGEPPVIYGDGTQSRDFVLVKDVVAATIQAAESDAGGVYNIGRGESATINQLVALLLRLTGNSFTAAHEPPRAGDIRHSLADITAAASFGYRPAYSLEAGLKYLLEHTGQARAGSNQPGRGRHA